MPSFVRRQHLWVTPYADDEKFPAGMYPLEPAPRGLEQWTERNRSLVGKDLVLWHTIGVTHIPRPEDFPVMCAPSGCAICPWCRNFCC